MRSCLPPSNSKGERRRRCPWRVFVTGRCCRRPRTRGHTCECQHGAVKCDRAYLDSNKFQFNTSNQTSLMEKTTVTRPIGMERGGVTFTKPQLQPLFLHIEISSNFRENLQLRADKSNTNTEAQRRLLAANMELFCSSISVPTCISA